MSAALLLEVLYLSAVPAGLPVPVVHELLHRLEITLRGLEVPQEALELKFQLLVCTRRLHLIIGDVSAHRRGSDRGGTGFTFEEVGEDDKVGVEVGVQNLCSLG